MNIGQRAAAIRDLIGQPGGTPADQRIRQRQADAHKEALIAAYGALRGWKQSGRSFHLSTLAKGGMHDGGRWIDRIQDDLTWPMLDHVYYWKRDRRPVAIVAHPYDCTPERLAEAAEWAAMHRLKVTAPADFPSWWYPGWTTLIEITRALP